MRAPPAARTGRPGTAVAVSKGAAKVTALLPGPSVAVPKGAAKVTALLPGGRRRRG
ncbi:hypothetical protein [Actinomyces weissii]|uniref:Uncharacterized protein n=1 Tax=Actinomyces weissii TaxID=675090 RepID=A0A7T7MAN2_9ACTO|nr:hypothetical protein [Actinomyces weissii]QQM67427.1 hypothetical protein JG540_00470 [Actinomyces weissii]